MTAPKSLAVTKIENVVTLPGVDTEPRGDDIEATEKQGELPLSTAQRRFIVVRCSL
jgi:hypothetical protein